MKSFLACITAILALILPSLALNHHQARQISSYADRRHPVSTQPNFSFDQLLNLTTTFFDHFLYPLNSIQAKSINSSLFAVDVLGRVDATRTFDGRELNTEYAFGLFANIALNPSSFTLLGIPVSYDITHFAANQNIVSLVTIVSFKIPTLGVTVPVEVDFWITFNAQGQVSQYDSTFRYLQWQFDYLFKLAMPLLKVNSTSAVVEEVSLLLASSICSTAQKYCFGTNKQYDTLDACNKFLTKDVRFGQAYELGRDTLLCRMVHQNMVPSRPDIHCPHIGPSGGGYCNDDMTYIGTVLQPYFKNAPFVPYGHQNKNATIAAM